MNETRQQAENYSLAWLLMSAVGTMLAALVLTGIVAGHLQLPITGEVLLAGAGLGTLPTIAAVWRGKVQPGWLELLAVLAGIAAVGALGLWLAWPSLLPLGISVDATHHFQLIEWIGSRGALPPINDDTRGLLGEMNAYPPGFALLVVAAARAVGQPVLETMYPSAAVVGALVAGLVVLLASGTASGAGENKRKAAQSLALLLGPLLLLAHRTFFVEAYIGQSYYTMALGVFFALLAIVKAIHRPNLSLVEVMQAGLALAALLVTYPLWAPIPGALLLLILLKGVKNAPRSSGLRRLLGRAALAFGPALVIALIDVLPRLRTGQAVLAHEGTVTLPTLARLFPLVLAVPGALLLLMARQGGKLVLGAGLTLGAALALAVLSRTAGVAGYHALKLLFLLTPLAAALVSGAVARSLAEQPRWRTIAGVALAALTLALSTQIIPGKPVQILSPELVAATRWFRATQPDAAYRAPVIGTQLAPLVYWVQIGLLGQRRDTAPVAQRDLTAPMPAAESWLIDGDQPSIALATTFDPTLPSTRPLAQFGPAAVIERIKPLDNNALNPLSIRYRCFWEDGRLKTAIELLQPLPGPLPALEIALYSGGAVINRFALAPDPQRPRTQYLGADLLPATLGGEGYVNSDEFPKFAAPAMQPTGALSLTLRLMIGEQSVEERPLATFMRGGEGQIEGLAVQNGELVYLRHQPFTELLNASTINVGGGLQLSGWLAPTQAARGGTATVGLRWKAQRAITRSFFPEVQLLDTKGQVVANNLSAPQGGFYPTWRWRPGEEVDEERTLMLPPELQPGTYHIRVLVHDFAAQRVIGSAELGALTIE